MNLLSSLAPSPSGRPDDPCVGGGLGMMVLSSSEVPQLQSRLANLGFTPNTPVACGDGQRQ